MESHNTSTNLNTGPDFKEVKYVRKVSRKAHLAHYLPT
jgi:hypothetical protein